MTGLTLDSQMRRSKDDWTGIRRLSSHEVTHLLTR